jgi:hypothetical protein
MHESNKRFDRHQEYLVLNSIKIKALCWEYISVGEHLPSSTKQKKKALYIKHGLELKPKSHINSTQS